MKKGVIRPGHVQIRVLELDKSVKHYRDVLGLIEMNRDKAGRVYLKGWTETDKFSIVLREADSPGLDFMGFKVLNNEVLAQLRGELKAYGCKVEEIPAGELDDCGRRVRFDSPTGHMFEIYAEKKQTGKWGIADKNPEVWPRGLKGMKATRFDHCALFGIDIDGTLDLFTKVLGFDLSEQLIDDNNVRLAQFLTCSMKEHDIAFLRHTENGKLHHVSFCLETWEEVLRAADLIAMENIALDIGPTRHGLTHGQTVYFFDPSGNRNETFSGGDYFYPDQPPVTWTTDHLGKAIFYHAREVNERFMTALT
jgi:catechol 2,3-dioxygenase